MKIQKERHEEDSKGQKSPQTHKSAKWHGNGEQMNIPVTMCYNPVVSKLEATQRQR